MRYQITNGPIIEADDRRSALAQARELCGGSVGVTALDVACIFCEDRPVGNAARWINPTAPDTAPCPRCGSPNLGLNLA